MTRLYFNNSSSLLVGFEAYQLLLVYFMQKSVVFYQTIIWFQATEFLLKKLNIH